MVWRDLAGNPDATLPGRVDHQQIIRIGNVCHVQALVESCRQLEGFGYRRAFRMDRDRARSWPTFEQCREHGWLIVPQVAKGLIQIQLEPHCVARHGEHALQIGPIRASKKAVVGYGLVCK